MCGIAGIFAYRDVAASVDSHELRRMRDFMAARGPDGAGEWRSTDGRVGLGHRRLAIIDLDDRAAQPMLSEDGSLVIVLNGEIYNYRELKRELEAKGVVFRTQSDTEVLLCLYQQRGSAMVQHLRGMFAFAIWDTRKRTLFLARDPFGIKPLYLADDGRTLRFASQVKALAAGGGVPKEPSSAGMAGFFLWGHVPEPWTWLASVKALPAGSTLVIQQGQPTSQPRQYFDLREEIVRAEAAGPPSGDALKEAVEAVADSVRSHLVSDVPVGAFLSAGRDSTLIAGLAANELREPLQTLTLGFDEYRDTANDEVPAAEAIARTIGASHRTVRIARSDFEAQREHIFASMDQPSIDGINTYFVSRAAADGKLKVALSGLGGDELFGGYPSFRQVPWLSRRLAALSLMPQFGPGFRLASSRLLRHLSRPKWAGLFEYGNSLAGAYLLRRSLFMPWELPSVMAPELAQQGLAELSVLEDLQARIQDIHTPAAAVMVLEMSCYMRNQLLRDADWAGMAHSLEIRVPFVDRALLGQWLPHAIRQLPFDRQQVLSAANERCARIIGKREKTGFSIPLQNWLRSSSPRAAREVGLRAWARILARRLSPNICPIRPIVLLTDAFGGTGGIAKFNRDLLAALDSMPECRRVDALPRLIEREPEALPAKLSYRFEAAEGKLAYVRTVLRLLLDGVPADAVFCAHLNLLPLARMVSIVKRCPLLLIVHGIEAWQPHHSRLVRALVQRADRVVAVSRHTADRLASWTGIPFERIHILPNCVDLAEFQLRPRNADLARRLGINGHHVLLTLGRLVAKERFKGFDEVLEILPDLARLYPDITYLIAGEGDDRSRLEKKARELKGAARVVFTGYVSEEEKKDLYSLADVYVMPSRGEGFGIVLLEAMASGLPAIGSSQDGSREALLNGKLGLVVNPDDRNGLIDAVHSALARPRGRPEGLEYFDVTAFRERLTTLVRNATA
ncbi:MAG TPA: asparagine synthase (glutamine-hydrolyzing) [Burkholderiales bacterium]|nr:asparagine synthase (glutamine-hydrolyzing) [Burkholderiales bacterium]